MELCVLLPWKQEDILGKESKCKFEFGFCVRCPPCVSDALPVCQMPPGVGGSGRCLPEVLVMPRMPSGPSGTLVMPSCGCLPKVKTCSLVSKNVRFLDGFKVQTRAE
ncbi:hypothetical protein NQD34_010072 [Periophthalmus magnuspinnatus]|nr:hypothetical protein NQD34_010072 [Periophthalmus magnuspinnatus]